MKASLLRVLGLAVLAAPLALPAAAADGKVALFHLDNEVAVGSVKIPAGSYRFQVSDNGLVRVYDENQTKVVAAAFAQRHVLKLDESEASGTLSHDWAVRTVTIGNWQYRLTPTEKPAKVAAGPSATTVVSQLR